jgi:hypothetical protein
MADKITEDDLKVEKTEGFKVGEKKTMDEYMKLGVLTPSILRDVLGRNVAQRSIR